MLIGLAVVVTGYILGTSYLSKGKDDPKISVTGLGQESFDSDLIVWRASFSRNAMDLKQAYSDLNADVVEVKKFLSSQEFKKMKSFLMQLTSVKITTINTMKMEILRNVFFEAMSLDSHSKYNPNQWIWLKRLPEGF